MSIFLTYYVTHYGYAALFAILGISILGIPIPGELLLAYAGFLSFSGKLNVYFLILASAAGNAAGITLAYCLGRLAGDSVHERIAKLVGALEKKKTFVWYQKYAEKILVIGYFIPGVRHLTGYSAGIGRLRYRTFAVYAYSGAVLWPAFFIVLGRTLGGRWQIIQSNINGYSMIIGVIFVSIFLLSCLIWKRRGSIKDKLSGQPVKLAVRCFALKSKYGILSTCLKFSIVLLFSVAKRFKGTNY